MTFFALVTFLPSMSRRKFARQDVEYLDLHMPLLPKKTKKRIRKETIALKSVSICGQTVIETVSDNLQSSKRGLGRTPNVIILFALS